MSSGGTVHGRLTLLDVHLWHMAHRNIGTDSPLVALACAVQPQPWMQDAACTTADPEAWFPHRGIHDSNTGRAMYLCRRVCTVREQCLAYAVAQPAPMQGIWGGTTEQQRRHLRQKEARA